MRNGCVEELGEGPGSLRAVMMIWEMMMIPVDIMISFSK